MSQDLEKNAVTEYIRRYADKIGVAAEMANKLREEILTECDKPNGVELMGNIWSNIKKSTEDINEQLKLKEPVPTEFVTSFTKEFREAYEPLVEREKSH